MPKIHEADKLPEDLSNYINFLHPWGNAILDPFVLMLMFFGLVIATIIALEGAGYSVSREQSVLPAVASVVQSCNVERYRHLPLAQLD